jgi:hypothetical protein
MNQYDVTFQDTRTLETKLHTVNAENHEEACSKASSLNEREIKQYKLVKAELVEVFTILASPLIKIKELLCK